MAFLYIVPCTEGFIPQTQKFEPLLILLQRITINGTIGKFCSGELSFESKLASMNLFVQRNKQQNSKAFYLNGHT